MHFIELNLEIKKVSHDPECNFVVSVYVYVRNAEGYSFTKINEKRIPKIKCSQHICNMGCFGANLLILIKE